jgi:hypothetical protein
LFGAAAYDPANERPDDIPFEEQLRGLEEVIKAGKVGKEAGGQGGKEWHAKARQRKHAKAGGVKFLGKARQESDVKATNIRQGRTGC